MNVREQSTMRERERVSERVNERMRELDKIANKE